MDGKLTVGGGLLGDGGGLRVTIGGGLSVVGTGGGLGVTGGGGGACGSTGGGGIVIGGDNDRRGGGGLGKVAGGDEPSCTQKKLSGDPHRQLHHRILRSPVCKLSRDCRISLGFHLTQQASFSSYTP